MAQYTFLNTAEINTITTQYAIGNIDAYKVLSGGSENTNYLLTTTVAKYVLTICEQKNIDEANQLAQLLEHLAGHNFVTSKIIRSVNNESAILWNEKPVILKAYIHGHIIEDLPKHLLVFLGKELGRLHQIEAPSYLPNETDYSMTHFEEVELYAPNSSFYLWLMEVKQSVQKYTSIDLPKSLIHSDVFCDNIIVSEDNTTAVIMDFEEASYYYRIFDVGMMIIGLCSEDEVLDLKKINHLLTGYQQEIEFTAIEKNALQVFTVYAAAAMSFWRHRNFNYIKPIPKMKDHYLALRNIANYVRKLPEGCFLNNSLED